MSVFLLVSFKQKPKKGSFKAPYPHPHPISGMPSRTPGALGELASWHHCQAVVRSLLQPVSSREVFRFDRFGVKAARLHLPIHQRAAPRPGGVIAFDGTPSVDLKANQEEAHYFGELP